MPENVSGLPHSDSNGPRTCPHCEMFYYEWLQTWEDMEAGREPTIPNIHECPEPFPFDVAESLVQAHAASQQPMHPRMKARCVLAYKAAGRA